MKTQIAVLFLIFSGALSAQSQTYNKHDEKFVGSWNGSEVDQQQLGLEKHWIQHRFADGTFVLLFTTIRDGVVDSFAEKGQWWIEDGKFHELHFFSGATDIYNFTFLDDYHVKFASTQIIESANDTYEFVDTKILDN